jgi:hypothetical protein
MPNVGRPPKFETADDLLARFEEWQAEFEEGGKLVSEIPDVEGFCDYVNAYRQLLMEYEKKPEFSTTIKHIRNWIYYKKKQLAMQGKMNPAIFIFDAKNNAGYTDKQEVDHTTNGKDLPQPLLGGISVSSNDSNS